MRHHILVVALTVVAETLVSCSGYSPDEQAAVDAYNGARSALQAGNEQNLRKALSAERVKGIEEMIARNGQKFSDFMASQRQYVPSEVKIVKVTVMDENGVFINLEGTRGDQTIQGNAFVKKEGGSWKLDGETWFWKGLPKKE